MTAPHSAKPSAKDLFSEWHEGGVGLSDQPETPEQEAKRLAWKKRQRAAWDEMMKRGGLR
jgi:hypothetical protein